MNIITKERMRAYVMANEHLVSVKKQAPNITVLKYKNKVFYKDLWTPELCELRGTVVDDDFNIIQRPPTKIFNAHEKKAPRLLVSKPCIASEKINGFMGCATIRNSDLFVSTTGSISSDFADLAEHHITMLAWPHMNPDLSYTFEICDPSDPHIVPEVYGAYLLGARYKTWEADQHALTETELDVEADKFGCRRPDWRHYDTYAELKEEARTVKHEGFVVWDHFGREIKIKSPYYLATKFLGRKTEKRLNEILEDTRAAKQILDEEYYIVLDHLAANKDMFMALSEQARFAFLRDYFDREVLK